MKKGTLAASIADNAEELQARNERLERDLQEVRGEASRAAADLRQEQNQLPRFVAFILGFIAGIAFLMVAGFVLTHCSWR